MNKSAAGKSAADLSFRPITDQDLIRDQLLETFTVDHMLLMGRPYPIRDLDVIGVYDADERLIGLALWTRRGQTAMVAAVISLEQRKGVARHILDHLCETARATGATRIRAMTTNDNLQAMRIYQLYGFRFTALYVNALDMLRAMHPSLEKIGMNGIPRRDAIEMEMEL
jgi:ribosomal protein S18 acetylase RimI-like enzyme